MIKNSFSLILLLFFLSACKSNDNISLQEAEKIIVNFNGVTFVPPPRSIGDLKDILPTPKISASRNLAQKCHNIEKDGFWINRFNDYLMRYKPNDWIDKSVDDMGNWGIDQGWGLLRGISIMEIRRGNYSAAVSAQKKYLKVIPNNKKGAYVPGYAQLSIMYTGMGELNLAKRALAEAQSWDSRTPRRPVNKIVNHDSWLATARGDLSMANGNLQAAEKDYRTALAKKIEFRSYSPEVALTQSLLAKALAQQGRLLEAENEIRQAIQHAYVNSSLNKLINAPILYRLSEILLLQGRYQEAQMVAASAVWVYQKGCISASSIKFAEARRSLAYTLSMQDNHREVIELFQAIENALGVNDDTFKMRFENDIIWSYALIKTSQSQAAINKLTKALYNSRQVYGNTHPNTAVNQGFLALAELEAANMPAAHKHFAQSVKVLLAAKNRNQVNPHYRMLIFEAYLKLLTGSASRGDEQAIAMMLKMAEALRISKVQEAVSAMGARAAVNDQKLAALLRREQNSRNRLKSLELTLINALSNGLASSENLKSEVQSLRKAHKSISESISQQYPDYAEILQPQETQVSEIQKFLYPDEALIVSYVGKKRTYIWSIRQQQKIRFHYVDLGYEEIKNKVNQLLLAMNPTGPQLKDIPRFDIHAAYELYRHLLEPLEDSWNSAEHLLLVSHGPLGYLPFALLPTKKMSLTLEQKPLFSGYRQVPWLINKHSISVLPSASTVYALQKIENLTADNKTAFIGFGAPLFSKQQMQADQKQNNMTRRGSGKMLYRAEIKTRSLDSATIKQLPALPETADELKEIASVLNSNTEASVITGLQANENIIKERDLTSFNIVMFATHGLIPGDINGLTQPALALTAPELTGLSGDGLLTMDEIMNLELNADWVILSACNTGSSEGESAEAVSGLGRAFFYAGAHSLLVSNWSVESQSSKLLTTGIFKNRKNKVSESRANALRGSMLNLLNDGVYMDPGNNTVLFSYAHPIFWAPFSLIGDGR